MKIELFSLQDSHAEDFREFLNKNSLPYKEILSNKDELKRLSYQDKVSILKINKSSSINIITGFNEFELNQLLKHINKYNTKIKI